MLLGEIPADTYFANLSKRRSLPEFYFQLKFFKTLNFLTHSMPQISFYTPENIRKPGFLLFSGGYGKRPVSSNGLRFVVFLRLLITQVRMAQWIKGLSESEGSRFKPHQAIARAQGYNIVMRLSLIFGSNMTKCSD